MDNAVRFDDSKILKNGDKAYSLDQESVDFDAELFIDHRLNAHATEQLDHGGDVMMFLRGRQARQREFALCKQVPIVRLNAVDVMARCSNAARTHSAGSEKEKRATSRSG